ncbi:MAG: GNAT family N-acetyltransferase [Holosporales bacterium]
MSQLIDFYREAEDYFFRGISSKCLDLYDSARIYMTSCAELNFIYITKNTNALDKILTEGTLFFEQYDLSFDVIIPQELCSPHIINVLYTMDYPQKSKSVSMVIDLDKFLFDQSVNLDHETLIKANNERLNDWMIPLIGAFESTCDICRVYAATHENALKKNINLRHFSMYKTTPRPGLIPQEMPIASITLSMRDTTIARIDDLGTLPEFQRKGYASALMRYALSEAKRLGAHHCFLESSDSGLGVYRKLGFEPLFQNNVYSRKASN